MLYKKQNKKNLKHLHFFANIGRNVLCTETLHETMSQILIFLEWRGDESWGGERGGGVFYKKKKK